MRSFNECMQQFGRRNFRCHAFFCIAIAGLGHSDYIPAYAFDMAIEIRLRPNFFELND
ncbi:hypothetical protein IE4872_CH02385 [Rhizobium gallicum]|uniref:Uncharacterized protein n=1 Tax=Rhizobium gallicum TaxID=56730 RepID=A0A1L5NJG0_9HYPH|nr:hypothetical protein IE4872_CH02385 [Rhizobium gallicum]